MQDKRDIVKKRKLSDVSKKISSNHKTLKSARCISPIRRASNGQKSHDAGGYRIASERTKERIILPKVSIKPGKRDGKHKPKVRTILPKDRCSIESYMTRVESTKSNISKSLRNSTGSISTSDAKVTTETKSKDDTSSHQKKFKPSSSLRKKRLDDDGSSGETSKKNSNVQPLEFIDLSKSEPELAGETIEQTSGNLTIPELDPLAPEQGGSSEVNGLSSFPLFNFMNQTTSLCLIDNSPPSGDNAQLSDAENDGDDVIQCVDNDEEMSDNDASGNLVIDEQECSMDITATQKEKPSNTTNQECDLESPISEEMEVESKKVKEKVKKPKRRVSQEGRKINLKSTGKGPAENIEIYTCMICSMEFKRERDLLIHGLFKHGETSPLDGIQCNDCGLTTSTIGSLYSHQNSEHLNKPKFKCPHCIYEGSEPVLFHTHIINNHSKMITKSKIKVKIN